MAVIHSSDSEVAVNNSPDSNNGLVAANLDETRAECPSLDINQNFRVYRNRQEDHEERRKDSIESEEESFQSDYELHLSLPLVKENTAQSSFPR